MKNLHNLHKENLKTAELYVCRHQLPIPTQLSELFMHPNSVTHLINSHKHSIQKTHPLFLLKRLLTEHKVHLIPSDKTHQLTLFPYNTYKTELQTHLNDTKTYTEISVSSTQAITYIENSIILQAQHFFKDYTIKPSAPKSRYLFILPKLHKPIQQWRNPFLVPKTRPIISDTLSNTHKLSRKLRPSRQTIERSCCTICIFSLQVIHSLTHKPQLKHLPSQPFIVTVDVESLFTNIPLPKLKQIILSLLPNVFSNQTQLHSYFTFLSTIITYNTFTSNNKSYIQTKGLPMGGCLSGALANIYLATLEQKIIKKHKHNILYYTRYMDDILIIHKGPIKAINTLIHNLQHTFQLSLTHLISQTHTTYLDILISYSPSQQQFNTSLHSKNFRILKFPLSTDLRQPKQTLSLINTQLTRLWRLSTSSLLLTNQIHFLLNTLIPDPSNTLIQTTIQQFFFPVQLTPHTWSSNFLLCTQCKTIIHNNSLQLTKTMQQNTHIHSSTNPASCTIENILFLLHSPPPIPTFYHGPTNIHNLLPLLSPYSTLLPLRTYNLRHIQTLIQKHSLQPYTSNDTIEPKTYIFPCHLHNMKHTYGIPSVSKASTPLTSFFNSYKKQ